MTVQLSSLRVTSDYDPSGFVRGAQAQTAASDTMARSASSAGAAMAALDAQAGRSSPGVARLSREFVTGYGEAARFEARMRSLGDAVDRGLPADRAATILEGIYQKFGRVADGTALAERGYVALAPIVDQVNAKLNTQNEVLARTAAATRALADAQTFQSQLNARLGVTASTPGAARASAEAFMAPFGGLEAIAKERARAAASTFQSELNRRLMSDTGKSARASAAVFEEMDEAAKGAAKSTGLVGGQIANLGYQLNDVVTGVLTGQSPFMIMAQQGGQVYQVLGQHSQGVGGALKQLGGLLVGLITPAVAVTGTLAAIGGAGIAAMASFVSAQREVVLSLTGIGRAAGVTAAQIEGIASSSSSTFGLSVREARSFSAALASVGAVGSDEIGRVAKLGHDFSVTFGVDSAEAARTLGAAMADPVRGAEQLNQRLGFMDAAMRRNIQNLVEQNKLAEAQRVIIDGIAGSVAKANSVTGFWSQVWTAISNAVSNAYDNIGGILARASGVGLSLEDQLENARKEVTRLRAEASRPFVSDLGIVDLSTNDRLVEAEKRVRNLAKALEDAKAAATDAKLSMDSLRLEASVRSFLPELAARQELVNRQMAAGATSEDPVLQRKMGLTQDQVNRSKAIADQLLATFKTTFQEIQIQSKTAYDAITAFSPTAKANIAYRETEERLRKNTDLSPQEKLKAAQDAYNVSLKTSITALSEAARERALDARQQTAGAQVAINAVDKSVGEQYRLQAVEQARAQLEQEASRNRTAFDQAQLDRLTKQIEKTAALKQIEAERKLIADVGFERSQIGRSDIDRTVAERLRGIYGSDYANHMNDAIGQQIRFNEQLKQTADLSADALKGFISDLRQGKSFTEALSNAVNKFIDSIINRSIDNLVRGILGNVGNAGGAGGAGGGFGLLKLLGFANGGIMTPQGAIPLNRYAVGGVAFGPQLALYGEGRRPEAYVPLPDGRSIPVSINMPAQTPFVASPPTAAAAPQVRIIDQTTGGNSYSTKPSADGTSLDIIIKDRVAPALAADINSNKGPLRDAVRHSQANYWG